MEDDVASRLLDWALRLTDDSLVRHCGGRERGTAGIEADADPIADPASIAYDAADQARRLLDAVAAQWRGRPPAEVAAAVAPLLRPPLFDSPLAGQEAVEAALAALAALVAREGPADSPQSGGPPEQPPAGEANGPEGAPGARVRPAPS